MSAIDKKCSHVPGEHEHHNGRDWLVCARCGTVYAVTAAEATDFLAKSTSAPSLFDAL